MKKKEPNMSSLFERRADPFETLRAGTWLATLEKLHYFCAVVHTHIFKEKMCTARPPTKFDSRFETDLQLHECNSARYTQRKADKQTVSLTGDSSIFVFYSEPLFVHF